MSKIDELITALNESKKESCAGKILKALAVVGIIAAIVGAAYAIYRYLSPEYLEDDDEFEDDFEDDFDDFFEDEDEYIEEEPAAEEKEEAPAEEAEEKPAE